MRRTYSTDREAVFQWSASSGERLDRCLKEVLAFLREGEGRRRARLIDRRELGKVVETALAAPWGGRGYLWGGRPATGRRRYATSVLGYAWVGIGSHRFLSLYYSRLAAPGEYDLTIRMAWAGLRLEEHLRPQGGRKGRPRGKPPPGGL